MIFLLITIFDFSSSKGEYLSYSFKSISLSLEQSGVLSEASLHFELAPKHIVVETAIETIDCLLEIA